MTRSHHLAALITFALLLGPSPTEANETNLLENGGFEDGLEGWKSINNTGRFSATVQSEERAEGKHALRLGKQGGIPVDLCMLNVASLPSDARARVSFKAKGNEVGNTWFKFRAFDAEGTLLNQDVDVAQLRGTFDWKTFEKTYDLPAGAERGSIQLMMVMGGELFIDDVRIERVEDRAPLDKKTIAWLDKNSVEIESLESDAPFDDLMPLKEVLQKKRIVQLGEPSHGDGTCFEAKVRLVKFLHEAMGFDVIAWEAGMYECEHANALLAEGKVREAMFASVPGVWRVQEVRPLFEYMAETAKTDRPLRLTGFDVQATGGGALELASTLDEAGRPLCDEVVNGIWNGKANELRKSIGELCKLLEGREGELRKQAANAKLDPREVRQLGLLARSLANLRLWAQASADGNQGKEAINARDARMADNLRWLIDDRYKGKKIITWAATFHLMHGSKSIREDKKQPYKTIVPMGEVIHKAYGKDCYTVGFAVHRGQKGTPFWGPHPIPAPIEDSIEDLLVRYGKPHLFVDLSRRGPLHKKSHLGILGYSRDMEAVWPKVVDGLVFIAENAPSTVLRGE